MKETNHFLPIVKGYISTIYLDQKFNPIYVGLMNQGPDPKNIEYHIALSIAYNPNFEISEVYCFNYSSEIPFKTIDGKYFSNRINYLNAIDTKEIEFIKNEYFVQNPLYSDIETMFAIAFIQSVPIDMIMLYNNTVSIQFLQTNKRIETQIENVPNIALYFNYEDKTVEVLTSKAQGIEKKHEFSQFIEILNCNNHTLENKFSFIVNNLASQIKLSC